MKRITGFSKILKAFAAASGMLIIGLLIYTFIMMKGCNEVSAQLQQQEQEAKMHLGKLVVLESGTYQLMSYKPLQEVYVTDKQVDLDYNIVEMYFELKSTLPVETIDTLEINN